MLQNIAEQNLFVGANLEDQEGDGNAASRGILEKHLVRSGGEWN
jgi:hypothetical protein